MAVAVGTVPALGFALVEAHGWRGAYEVFGIGIWLLLIPLVVLVFRDRPEDMGQELDGVTIGRKEASERVGYSFTMEQVLRTRSYWIAVVCMASWSMSGTGAQFHIVSIFAERGLGPVPLRPCFALRLHYGLCASGGRHVGRPGGAQWAHGRFRVLSGGGTGRAQRRSGFSLALFLRRSFCAGQRAAHGGQRNHLGALLRPSAFGENTRFRFDDWRSCIGRWSVSDGRWSRRVWIVLSGLMGLFNPVRAAVAARAMGNCSEPARVGGAPEKRP